MALENFGSSLKQTFRKIAGLGVVDKEAVEAIVRDLQRTLLQADVDVQLVLSLSNSIKKKMLQEQPPAGLTLKEYFVKTVYDELVAFLGKEKGDIALRPQKILLVGLFGSGKTTTAGKLAKWFKTRGLRAGLAACDVHRPAAKEQLMQIGQRIDVPVYTEGKTAAAVAIHALKHAREEVLIVDTAGRDALDEALAAELRHLGTVVKPDEVLLVIPADIGQAARKQAEEFHKLVGITGIIVTKLDGTAKGGGALAAASVSGAPVKFVGVGEKAGDFEQYDPKRFVSRLIGYGDLQGLLEKAREVGNIETAQAIMEGEFTLNEFADQIASMQKMGSLSKVVDMIPGLGKVKMPEGFLDVQEDKMKRWRYAIDSMTRKERKEPEEIRAPQIKRIARGSGLPESEVRELLKHYKQAKKVMKMAKGGKGLKRGPLAQIAKQLGLKMG